MSFLRSALAALTLLLLPSTALAQDVKISALPTAAPLSGTEKVPAVQTGANVALTPNQVVTLASQTLQAKSTVLTSIAGQTWAADNCIAWTSSTTVTPYACTSFWRGLAVNSTAANARAALGLAIGTDVQAYNAKLAAISGLTVAADNCLYWIGASAAASFGCTSYGRSLINGADAAATRTLLGLGSVSTQSSSSVAITGGSVTGITDLAVADGGTGASTASGARTNLGLVIGTDVQAQDTELSALAGTTSATDKLPYFTGAGTASTADFTAAARTLLDDTTTSAMRTTLGVAANADVQVFTASGTWTKPSGAKSVRVIVCGGGGGGGGGSSVAASTAASGGGGGGGADCSDRTWNPADLSSSATVTVGAGGTSGAGAASGAGAGSAGGVGGTSIFDNKQRGFGGGGGAGGQAGANAGGGGSGGATNAGSTGTTTGGNAGGLNGVTGGTANAQGGSGGGLSTSGGTAAAGGNAMGPSGGGAGGTLTAANATTNGGAGGLSMPFVSAAGAAGGTAPGGNGTLSTTAIPYSAGGNGGGGGASATAAAGGTGADGQVSGGGAGGGGATQTGFAGGNGGVGGGGRIVVITHF